MAFRATYLSKIPSEKHNVTWKIADFALIRGSKRLLEALRLQFEMGASIGLPSTWKCYLKCTEVRGKVWIGAYVYLKQASVRDQEEVLAKVVSIKVGNGQYYVGGAGVLENWLDSPGCGYAKMIPQDEKDDGKVLPLDADGSLSVVIEMVLFNFNATPTLSVLESQFETKFKATLQRELGNMLNCTDSNSSTTPMMVRVIASDGTSFSANRGILAARSDVFRTMFQTPMAEVQQGLVKVDDISGPALKILLSYMHDGILPAEWKDPEIIAEFVYGAHKYMLEDLKVFLDPALGKACTPKNCTTLLNLANKLDMKTARKELLEFFKGQLKDATWEELDRLLIDYQNQNWFPIDYWHKLRLL